MSKLICLSEDHLNVRWIWVWEEDSGLFVVESPYYTGINEGYSMTFAKSEDFEHWLTNEQLAGWHVSVISDNDLVDKPIGTEHTVYKLLRNSTPTP